MVGIEKLRKWIANQSATFLDHAEADEYARGSYDSYECTLRFLNSMEASNASSMACPDCGAESQPASYSIDWCPKCGKEWEAKR